MGLFHALYYTRSCTKSQYFHGSTQLLVATSRHQLVQEIQKAALLYKTYLVGRKFLYIFEGQYIEVIYSSKGFKHLTGVESPLTAKLFFDNAVKRKLSINNIGFSSKHPYDLCVRKVKHLCQLPELA